MLHDNAAALLDSRPDLTDRIIRAFERLIDCTSTFEDAERAALRVANELVRRVLEKQLQQLADRCGDEFVFQSAVYRPHHAGTVEYHSLCGPLRVTRSSYRASGVRNGPTVIPLEIQARLIEDATPALAFSVAQGYAKMPSRHYEEEMRAAFRIVPSRSTLERMGKRMGGVAKSLVAQVEPELRAAESLPSGARSISVGLDRASVPMIEERPATEKPSTLRKKRTKPYVRTPPHPFDVAYRMAYVGTVSVHDKDGVALRTWRFAATPEEGADDLTERVMLELKHLRSAKSLPLTVVQDGAPELWNLLRDGFRRHGIRPTYEVIDRYHFEEHLGRALDILIPDRDERHRVLCKFREALNRDDDAIDDIATMIEREDYGCTAISRSWDVPKNVRYARRLSRDDLRELNSHCTYIVGNRERFRYATLLKRSLPIGSGVTEGACKSVIGARFKRSGAHWYQDGLSACLTLRTLYLSERFESFWPHMQRHYSTTLAA